MTLLCELSYTYNYVMSGFQKGNPVILKLGLDSEAVKIEAFALKCFAGYGAVKVLATNENALLLEQAIPGTSLKKYFPDKDIEAVQIACKIMKKLHHAKIPDYHPSLLQSGGGANNFPHIKDWLSALDKDWDLPSHYLQKARKLRDQLLQTAEQDILLHGDLHHDNILQNGDDWMVIDPKGVIGKPAYEITAFIRNPIPDLLSKQNAIKIIQNRIIAFSDILNIPKSRIADWCFVGAVLSWTWAIQGNLDTKYWKQITKVFDEMP
ncbi:MAG: uncharacterized protein K0R73_330 [Candidatus Midichloriaceae bacterium]|jgi:streptomycin 6-kinase|nr:uncharacterized protein [Candidatus Midichloriaceae bacterium]